MTPVVWFGNFLSFMSSFVRGLTAILKFSIISSLNSKDDLEERLNKAKKEIEMKLSFDHSITNDKLDFTKSKISEIVKVFLKN